LKGRTHRTTEIDVYSRTRGNLPVIPGEIGMNYLLKLLEPESTVF